MNTVTSRDGTRIAFDRGGAGPHLVLVHGTTAGKERWAPVRPRLEKQFTVTAIDRRGRGDSGDRTDYAIEREFEDVLAVIDALDSPVILFGHSFGAICALEAAMRSDKLAGLVLYEPPMFEGRDGSGALSEELDALLDAGDREGVLTTFFTKVVRMPPDVFEAYKAMPVWPARVAAAHTLPRELRAAAEYTMDEDRIGGLSIPVLLLLGDQSPPPFVEVIAALEKTLPDVRLVVMPDQHHNAMDTGPDLVSDAVIGFSGDIR